MKKVCKVTFEEVTSVENLCEAWQEFTRGKRNRKDVQKFSLSLGDNICALHEDLMRGTYKHGSYEFFRIHDPKPRDIHKATVRDRLLHHAIHRKLYPFFETTFIADSFSCQFEKGVHRALRRFQHLSRIVSQNHTRTCWVLKGDVRRFFASVDHGVLLALLAGRITDARLLQVIECIVRSFETAPGKGIPLGNLTSQLFANIYMNELDQFVKHRLKVSYCRYADDVVLLSDSRDELQNALLQIRNFLTDRLFLELHSGKLFLRTIASGVDFLGWTHFPYHLVPRTKTKKRMMKRIYASPTNETLQSYLGLLSHGDAYLLSEELRNLQWLSNKGNFV